MPGYRRVRERHDFLEMCRRPELAAEVTVTAVERLKVDAAIIFADILLPLIPMEVGLHYETGDGPVIDRPIRSAADLERIPAVDLAALGFVGESIKLVHSALGATTPLIGFAGAPFTIAPTHGRASTMMSPCRGTSIQSRCSPTSAKSDRALARFWIRRPAAPVTSSTSDTEFFLRLRSIT